MEVKKAILKRIGINEESYRQRFHVAKLKEGEAYGELSIRLGDLFDKWMIECKSIVDVKEKVVVEQLVTGMPRDLRVWVAERKPNTADMAAELADDYVQARRHEWKLLRDEGQWNRQKKTLGVTHVERLVM